ncbi:LuxR family transcriptional regulator [Streptomyces sp. J2-1]|uniref:LuxR family transcriptional regulator n=1 Tax=Streptomyces corallincola TaxID=2851888 RepID=UPI001C384309|nr:LuxR family transcriptional regulator [Streptomyces corallincola]MBV2353713.1 LuxR family transcriptional regulator [Streptomyces corallincola]
MALGMLVESEDEPGRLVPVNPRLAEARLGVTWRTAALQLLEQAGDLSEALAPLISEFQESTAPIKDSDPLVHLRGKALISACVDDAVSRCTRELITAQPGGGRPATTLSAVSASVRAALFRGVSVRTLYQHTAWHAGPTRDFVEEMTRLGARVRTLDEFFERLIIVDRRTAFLPASPDRSTAVMVQDPAVVGFLADVFDRNWQRATEFTGRRTPERSVEITGQLQQQIVRGLIGGESDAAIAKRIGLSQRSYASHLARMKEELGVDTRFQLGYTLAKSGAA